VAEGSEVVGRKPAGAAQLGGGFLGHGGWGRAAGLGLSKDALTSAPRVAQNHP